jgi:hypothetical protein
MTSKARLAAAICLSAIALVFGWLSPGSGSRDIVETSARAWSPHLSVEAEDIDNYVTRVAAAGLFPRASLRMPGAPVETAEGLAQALQTPNLSALVRRGDTWRIYIYDDGNDTLVFRQGDQLSDGWSIASIAPTQVILRRDEETRRLDAFRTGEDTDED